jgi:hypothetical protein
MDQGVEVGGVATGASYPPRKSRCPMVVGGRSTRERVGRVDRSRMCRLLAEGLL